MKAIVACVYRPPNCSNQQTKQLLSFLSQYLNKFSQSPHMDIHILGDLNMPNIDWSSLTISPKLGRDQTESAEHLFQLISENLLSQIVDKPTRKLNILDVYLTNNDRSVINVDTSKTPLSDHNLVKINLDYNPAKPVVQDLPVFDKDSFQSLDLVNCDYELLNSKIQEIDWDALKDLCSSEDDGSEFLAHMEQTILHVFLLHAPRKPEKKEIFKNKFNHNRRTLNRRRRKLTTRLNALLHHYPESPKISKLKDEISIIYLNIRDSHKHQLEEMEQKAATSVKSNPKYFFSYAKRFAKAKSSVGPLKTESGQLTTDAREMAEILQKQYQSVFSNPSATSKTVPESENQHQCSLDDIHFGTEDIIAAIKEIDINATSCPDDIPVRILNNCCSSLAYPISLIWKESLETGNIPNMLKQQYITPVFKKGDKSLASNYRPISLTSHIIKIFERVMRKQIISYLETNNLLTNAQHGFRSGRSCLSQLLDHIDKIMQHFQDGHEVDVIYLDYAKAFDKVDHEILIAKLKRMGIKGKLLEWIKAFLKDRCQVVMVNGKKSYLAIVISGVPQGSVLGPLLFLIYINDLIDAIKHSKASCFADDTKVSGKIGREEDRSLLQHDLDAVISWSTQNNMDLHEQKFELLNYGLKKSSLLRHLPFTSNLLSYTTQKGTDLEPSSVVRDLGVTLTSDCSWSLHINTIADRARKMASWVLGVFQNRSRNIMLLLYKSMVRSRLEYCCPLWDPHLVRDIQTLESVQRAFTRRIAGVQQLDYWERLDALNLMSLQRRRERYIIIYAWKIHKGLAPNDLGLEFYDAGRLGLKARLPPFRKGAPMYIQSMYDQSFAVKAPKLWNTLPLSVNTSSDLDSLKTRLGVFLKGIPDRPPTIGYTAACRNSILDWGMQTGGMQHA